MSHVSWADLSHAERHAERQRILEVYRECKSIWETVRRSGRSRKLVRKTLRAAGIAVPREEGRVEREGVALLVSELMAEQQRATEPPKASPDITAIIRQAVEAELARHGIAGATGKTEIIVAEEHEEAPRPSLLVQAHKPYRRVAFLSDFHFPFQSQPAIDAALNFLGDWKPDLIILGGDQVDCYRISEYESDPGRAITLQDELDSIAPFWKAIDAFRSADVVVFEGNHEHRLSRLVGRNPGLYNLRSLSFPIAAELPKRFQWCRSQTHYKVGSLVFLHGDLRGRGNSVKHAAAGMLDKLRTSCVFGHFHRSGSHYETGYDGTVRAGFAVGHMSDSEKAAEYIRSPSWQSGFATVEFDHDEGIFHLSHHLIVGGRFKYGGKTYGA